MKAETTKGESFWMNPTVSLISNSPVDGKVIFLVVVSKVENNLSCAITSDELNLLNRVLFPAFVYPTMDTIGMPEVLRLLR